MSYIVPGHPAVGRPSGRTITKAIKINPEVQDYLAAEAKRVGMSQSALIELALRMYKDRTETSVDVTAFDDADEFLDSLFFGTETVKEKSP